MNIERLSEMIHELSAADFALVSELVERLSMKKTSFHFPLDDEPTTSEDIRAIEVANNALKNNELIRFTDIENELRN